jgi:hypothetical protein
VTGIRGQRAGTHGWAALLLGCAALGLSACGGATQTSTHTAFHDKSRFPYVPPAGESASLQRPTDRDHDEDLGSADVDTGPGGLGFAGHPATATDRAAIAALTRRYYAAAAARDGARACSMLYSPLSESIAENYGTAGGPEYDRGTTTCAAAATGVFHHYRALLAVETSRLQVMLVLVKEREAVAELGFGARLPRRELLFTREGRVWRVAVVRDRELR